MALAGHAGPFARCSGCQINAGLPGAAKGGYNACFISTGVISISMRNSDSATLVNRPQLEEHSLAGGEPEAGLAVEGGEGPIQG